MSPSPMRRSTWYRKSGRAVSQADRASLHRSRVTCLSSFDDISGATSSLMSARFPLFQSSSKYLRKTALFCSADMAHPFRTAGFAQDTEQPSVASVGDADCGECGTFSFPLVPHLTSSADGSRSVSGTAMHLNRKVVPSGVSPQLVVW